MPLYSDDFKNNPAVGCTDNVQLVGIDTFKKGLEKHFFSSANVYKRATGKTKTDLIIELECNFSLADAVSHFKTEIFNEPGENVGYLSKSIHTLQEKNDTLIDIDEFSLHMQDTTIVIHKIFNLSIPEQWDNVLKEVIYQFRHLTNGMKEIPFEIYIPVFEEQRLVEGPIFPPYKDKKYISPQDYFTYWGLYFDSEEDAVIYDLKTSSFIFEDLYMLNQ